jgi:hypothetical protein
VRVRRPVWRDVAAIRRGLGGRGQEGEGGIVVAGPIGRGRVG